jgi:chromosome segregation ATPase
MELVEIDEDLRTLERGRVRSAEQQRLEVLEREQKRLLDQLVNLQGELAKVERIVVPPEETAKLRKPLLEQIRDTQGKLSDLQEVLRKSWREEEEKLTAKVKDLRRRQIQAEEQLSLMDRKQSAERARIQGVIETLEERARQLEFPGSAPAPETELQRKLDRLLKEVTELRQEMKKGGTQPPK